MHTYILTYKLPDRQTDRQTERAHATRKLDTHTHNTHTHMPHTHKDAHTHTHATHAHTMPHTHKDALMWPGLNTLYSRNPVLSRVRTLNSHVKFFTHRVLMHHVYANNKINVNNKIST